MQQPQTSYFSQWEIGEYEDTSNTFDFIRRFAYHRFAKDKVTAMKKVYKTSDPHYKISIDVDIVLYHYYEKTDSVLCLNQPQQGHLKNPFCQLNYDWKKDEDFIILKIDGQPYKIDNFQDSQFKTDSYQTILPFSLKDIGHTSETLSIEFIPYNSKWNLYTIIQDLKIYYEVCDDQCLCLSCSQDGKCLKCPYTQFYNAQQAKCVDCSPNCYYCTDSTSCFSCKEGFYLNSSKQCEDKTQHSLEQPIQGYWVSSPYTNCEIWDKDSYCIVDKANTTCLDGFFGKSCSETCDPELGCKSCSQKGSCNQCLDNKPYYYNQMCSSECQTIGYYSKSNTECGACHYSCFTCSGPLSTDCLSCILTNHYYKEDTKQCILCEKKYYANDINDQCQLCSEKIDNCDECENINGQPFCNKCKVGSYLYLGVCYPNCSQFTETKQFEDPINECIYCYKGCYSCKEFIQKFQCTKCADGYFRFQNECLISCENVLGTYVDIGLMQCQNCQDYNCDKCSGAGTLKCQQCQPYYELTKDNTCQQCKSNQTYDSQSNRCKDCPQNCSLCMNQFECQFCSEGFFLDKQQPDWPCVPICSGLQYGNTETRKCKFCEKGTFKNQTSGQCDKCTEDGCEICQQNGKCDKCFPGYILNACNSTKQCTKCPSENQYSIGSSSTCFNCNPICKTCRAPGELMCETCADGYFKGNQYCFQCDISCSTCTSVGFCTKCAPGYNYSELIKKKNGQNIQKCYQQCPPKLNTDEINKTCYPCDYSCATCSGPQQNQCLTCNQLYSANYLTKDNECVFKCPLKTYADLTTLKCLDCHSSCLQCNSSSELDCTVCVEGKVYRDAQKLCINECPVGEFQDILTNTCQLCMNICQTCNSSDKCTSCKDNLYLSSDKTGCIFSCPDSDYKNDKLKKCIKCPENCIECNSETECTLCQSSFYIQKGLCVKDCDVGYYKPESTNSQLCLECNTDCIECTETECLKCIFSSLIIHGTTCVEECPKNYIKQNGQCIQVKEQEIKDYFICYVDCEEEKTFSENTDTTVKSIEFSQASLNAFSLFFGGIGNYFFYWIQMQQTLGNMVFLQNTKALGIGALHLKTLYMSNIFNLIPIGEKQQDELMKVFSKRPDSILQMLQVENIYIYFVYNCQYSLIAVTIPFFIIFCLFFLSKYSEFCYLLYLYSKWNLFIRIIMISSNFLLLCTFFKFQSNSFSHTLSIPDFLMISAFLIIYITLFSYLIYCNNSMSLDHKTLKTMNAFYYDIETSSKLQKHFWVIFEVRKLLVALLVVITNGSFIVPWIYSVTCLGFIFYCVRIVPFQKVLLQRYVLIAEVINLLCVLSLCIVVTFYEKTFSVYFAYVFVIFLIIYQVWSLITQIYQIINLLIILFLKYKVPVGSPDSQRSRNRSQLPFLLKGKGSKDQIEQIQQINMFDLTDMKNITELDSPKKKRETQGIFQI